MKKMTLLLCILFTAVTINAQQLTGVWNTGKDNTKIEVTKDQEVYQGKIVASDKADATIGNPIIKDLKSIDGEWKGKLFAPKKGKWLDAVFKEKGQQLLITVGTGFRSKTLEWTRE